MEKISSMILSILFSLPGMIIALSFHEFSHAYSAHLLGDDTAKSCGRMTLNPISHLDLLGTIGLIFFRIGWGKPVPIDSRNFKKHRAGVIITSAAGPVSNFVLAFIFSFFLVILTRSVSITELYSVMGVLSGQGNGGNGVGLISILYFVLYFAIMININLGIFNLIPVPPLDGSKILYMVLPKKVLFKILPYERYISLALIVLLVFDIIPLPIGNITNAVMNFYLKVWEGVVSLIV